VSIPAFALVLWLLGQTAGSLAWFYSCFFLAAFVGCGTTPILYTRAVAARFERARGLALGITLAGPGTAALLLPPFLNAQIATHDWRHGFLVLALIALVPWLLVAVALGPRAEPSARDQRLAASGHGRREALRSRLFWTLSLCFIVVAAGASALVVHMVPMLRDAGLDAATAARVASVIGGGIILGRLLIGWLIDRVFAPRVAAVIFAIAACGCLLLAYGGAPYARPAAFLVGFALGAEVDLMAYLVSRYFGLRHYGFLYGTIYAGFWIGIASGPALAGRLFDAFGNYELTLWLLCGLFITGSLLSLSLPRFRDATD
jgi:predicted MFS family arabinose efflux permease